jgi:photosystem I subunit V
MATVARAASTRAAAARPSASRPVLAPRRRASVAVRADLNTQLVVGASTVAALAVGRFAFLGQQRGRAAQSDAVGPKSGGSTYFEKLSQDASFIKSTGDPEGFGIIDVFAWGALGHAVAFAFLAAQSCGAGCIPGFQ